MALGDTAGRVPWAANLAGLDYRAEAERLRAPAAPIIDCHVHVGGRRAAEIFAEVSRLYGVERVWTQTQLDDAEAVRDVLGDAARFVAVPSWRDADRVRAFRQGFLEQLPIWRERFGASVAKFWAAPRLWDLAGPDAADLVPLDSPWRIRAAELAQSLGMIFMVHVGDPDTWFRTVYADRARYGAKIDQYTALERMLDRFGQTPWIAAHMGGWPEAPDFLDGMLARHANLYLDTSATRWVVRELSRHPRQRVLEFFTRWRGRVLFGSDIVTTDEHLSAEKGTHPMGVQAASADEAFDLYASRYWALRVMFETAYDGPSPIADPDLKRVDPERFDDRSSPTLRGMALRADVLRSLYHDAAAGLEEKREGQSA